VDPEEIKRLIEAGLEGSVARVSGDGRHFQAAVVCELFDGKNMLQQHRMVYATLHDHFASEALHALSVTTSTPQQWQARNGG